LPNISFHIQAVKPQPQTYISIMHIANLYKQLVQNYAAVYFNFPL